MMLVVTYDVDTSDTAGQKRLRKVAKICERYGMRVQNSVFEVLVDAAQLVTLKSELEKVIDIAQDSVRFYRLGNKSNRDHGEKASRRSWKSLDFLARRPCPNRFQCEVGAGKLQLSAQFFKNRMDKWTRNLNCCVFFGNLYHTPAWCL